MIITGREQLLLAQAIKDWTDQERKRPPGEQRSSDSDDLIAFTERELPSLWKVVNVDPDKAPMRIDELDAFLSNRGEQED